MNDLEKRPDSLASTYARRSVKLAAALRAASTVIELYGIPVAGDSMAGHAGKRLLEEHKRAVDLLDEIDREDREAIAKATLRDMPDRPRVIPMPARKPRLIPMGTVSDGGSAA